MSGSIRLALPAILALALAAGCNDDDDLVGPGAGDLLFNQIERLGNPLVSEVLIAKREHGHHNTIGPSQDVAAFKDDLEAFVTQVAGRPQEVATTLSSVLLPDMLIVQTSRSGSTAGWLTWALADGYGGRRLGEDVLDTATMAVFGPLLSPMNVSPGLTSDNVDTNDEPFLTSFPYLAEPHR